MNLKKLEPHALGAIFPPMGDTDYAALIASMQRSGYDQKQPIVLFEDRILDGNNRYTAAKVAKVEPTFDTYRGDDPVGFVMQRNLARRHLTVGQLAALGAEIADQLISQEQAQIAAGTPLKRNRGGTKTAKAAKIVGVSERSVASARRVKKNDPEKFDQIKKGKSKVGVANREVVAKQSAADRASEAFDKSEKLVAGILGDSEASRLGKAMPSKDFIKLSGLTKEEILRVKPLLDVGWKLKAAMGYKSTTLSLAHPIRQIVDRTVQQGGTFALTVNAYGQDFEIECRISKGK